MSRTAGFGAFICSVVLTVTFLQDRGWRGIVPLHSTREDVERLLGAPMMPGGITYDLKTERVNVGYSDGGCAKGKPAEWNVPLNTVIGIRVYPQTKLMLSDLRIDLKGFEKFIDPYNADSVSYSNNEQGISINTQSSGKVILLEYFPLAKDNHLRCPVQPAGGDARKFDEYSNLPFSDEKARLDNFAITLRKEPQFKGYIIVYAGPRARPGEAQARAKRAKNYLVKAHGIEVTRIFAIDGGNRDRLEVELYALPSSLSPPTPKPNRN